MQKSNRQDAILIIFCLVFHPLTKRVKLILLIPKYMDCRSIGGMNPEKGDMLQGQFFIYQLFFIQKGLHRVQASGCWPEVR